MCILHWEQSGYERGWSDGLTKYFIDGADVVMDQLQFFSSEAFQLIAHPAPYTLRLRHCQSHHQACNLCYVRFDQVV